MIKLVLVRHGQSKWNLENRFTGWTDVDLSDNGVNEAKSAGILLKEKGFHFNKAYTSVLMRANKTLALILEEMGQTNIPVKRSYRLNERHYGALQGLNKAETAAQYGDEQVRIWRRSADVRPPALEKNDPRYQAILKDKNYQSLEEKDFPLTEHLLDTVDRVVYYWDKEIKPNLKDGEEVIIAAHGNSLRALVKYLDNISKEEIMQVEIPTGKPLVYELDNNLKVIKSYYL